MFVRLLGLKKRGSVLGNKDNLHLISLGCSAGNNGRCSSVALNHCAVWAEWPSLFRAGAAGVLQVRTKALVSHSVATSTRGGREKNCVLVKPTPSLLLSQGRCLVTLGSPKGKTVPSSSGSPVGSWSVSVCAGVHICSALRRGGWVSCCSSQRTIVGVRQEQARPCMRCILLL